MRSEASFSLLLLCFFLSGMAGLIYETAWTREFSFVFGTSSLAVATVLAAYMAGLGAGAAAASRLAHRIRRPILVYGVLELGIALAALAIPLAVAASRSLYLALFGGLEELSDAGGLTSGLFYAACSFAILMVPTAMMGATLPLLARYAVRSEGEITGRIGVLYAVNTVGAVAGTLIAAFVLLPSLGLRNTIWAAAAVNGAVFLAAWALARSAPDSGPSEAPPRLGALGVSGWVLPLIFVSGAVSFSYEVLWVRLLDHALDGSHYSFATMLASFLVGIAAGAVVASRLGRTRQAAVLGFALAQLGAAALSLSAYLAVDSLPAIMFLLVASGGSALQSGALVSMLTLFPGAVCIGATFPLAVRILARDEGDASAASARVYAANTLGSIVGSLGAGFFVIPWLGYSGTLTLCVGTNLVLAAAASMLGTRGRRPLVVGAALGLLALGVGSVPQPWNLILVGFANPREGPGEVIFTGVGRTSTVLVRETMARWKLVTGGLPEATIDPPGVWHGATATPRWISSLPVLARPDLDRMLVIGLGGGVSLESIPPSVGEVSVVEIEPQVVAANRALGPLRWRDPLQQERIRLQVNDARNALLLADLRFDAIVSQPSHPWRGGAAHLYTQEFFELAASRLEAEGVFVQWMGQRYLDEELHSGLLATLHAVFGFVRVYYVPDGGALVFVASNAPLEIEKTSGQAIATNREAFSELGILVVEDVTAQLLLDARQARNVARDGIPNRDDHNRLQNRSMRPAGRVLLGRLDEAYGDLDPLSEWRSDSIDPFLILERVSAERAARLSGLAAASKRMPLLRSFEDRAVARAIVDLRRSGASTERNSLVASLERAPRHPFGRAALLRHHADEIGEGLDPESLVAPPLGPGEAAVVRGWRALGEARRTGWEERDAALSLPPRHPLHRDAERLRARWRIETGDPELAKEAIPILDRVIQRQPSDFLLRSEACLQAGDELAALDSLMPVALNRGAGPGRRLVVDQLRDMLERIPARDEQTRMRRALELVAGQDEPGVAAPDRLDLPPL